MTENNEHSHDKPIIKITVTIDPNHGQLNYAFENTTHYDAIGHLENAQLYMFHDMNKAQEETKHEPIQSHAA